jgi:hypothetical protein
MAALAAAIVAAKVTAAASLATCALLDAPVVARYRSFGERLRSSVVAVLWPSTAGAAPRGLRRVAGWALLAAVVALRLCAAVEKGPWGESARAVAGNLRTGWRAVDVRTYAGELVTGAARSYASAAETAPADAADEFALRTDVDTCYVRAV